MYLSSLNKLGLNEHEQAVYFALLQLEKATANEIAQKAQVKRTTTYDILGRLQNEGFVKEDEIDGKLHYTPTPPEQIKYILEDRKRALEVDLPALNSIYNAKIKKPKITYFEGLGGIKELYENILLTCSDKDEILAYVTEDTIKNLPEYFSDFNDRRAAKKIHIRGIYQDSLLFRPYFAKNREQLRQIRIVREEKLPIKNEINIYGAKMILLTYDPDPFGVLIESKEIVATQRSIFELVWKSIK